MVRRLRVPHMLVLLVLLVGAACDKDNTAPQQAAKPNTNAASTPPPPPPTEASKQQSQPSALIDANAASEPSAQAITVPRSFQDIALGMTITATGKLALAKRVGSDSEWEPAGIVVAPHLRPGEHELVLTEPPQALSSHMKRYSIGEPFGHVSDDIKVISAWFFDGRLVALKFTSETLLAEDLVKKATEKYGAAPTKHSFTLVSQDYANNDVREPRQWNVWADKKTTVLVFDEPAVKVEGGPTFRAHSFFLLLDNEWNARWQTELDGAAARSKAASDEEKRRRADEQEKFGL